MITATNLLQAMATAAAAPDHLHRFVACEVLLRHDLMLLPNLLRTHRKLVRHVLRWAHDWFSSYFACQVE